jgi:hypothetical protein
MLTIEKYLTDFPKIAEDMKRLQRSEHAVVRYELLSGSLVWSDEFPKGTKVNTDCLRFLFRYRTSLILGEPDKPYEVFWKEAQRHFPEWIGFALDRTSRSSELAAFYIRERDRALQELDGEQEI